VQPAGGGAAKPLLIVARADKVRVSTEVPELNASLVDVGDQVSLRVQALPGKVLQAPISRTSWSLDDSNRSLRAELDLANADSTLRPGMFATATITLDRRENALTIPVTAIFRVGDDAFCSCIESGKIQRHRVELGLRSGPDVEVLSGIDDNATIVATRGDAVPDGHPVQIIAPNE
jgi:RND family efflux transporter MFP subunit